VTKKKSTASSKARTEEPDFETAVAQVEALIDRIEQGEIGLEESVKAYEQGVKLIQRCREILNTAEQRIVELTEETDDADESEQG